MTFIYMNFRDGASASGAEILMSVNTLRAIYGLPLIFKINACKNDPVILRITRIEYRSIRKMDSVCIKRMTECAQYKLS